MHKLCALTYHFKYLSQLAPDLLPVLLHPFQIVGLITATFTFAQNTYVQHQHSPCPFSFLFPIQSYYIYTSHPLKPVCKVEESLVVINIEHADIPQFTLGLKLLSLHTNTFSFCDERTTSSLVYTMYPKSHFPGSLASNQASRYYSSRVQLIFLMRVINLQLGIGS